MHDPNANPFAQRSTPEVASAESRSVDGAATTAAPAQRVGIHAYTQAALIRAIDPNQGPDGGWWMLVEPDAVIDSSTVIRADVAGWRRSRLPGVPLGQIDVLPDWVCEVLSPGEVAHDRVVKLAAYANHGVPFVWLVHPQERTLEAYQLDQGSWRYLGAWTDGGPVAVPPFVEQEVDVGGLFIPLDDPSRATATAPSPVSSDAPSSDYTPSDYASSEPAEGIPPAITELPPL